MSGTPEGFVAEVPCILCFQSSEWFSTLALDEKSKNAYTVQ